MKAISLWQPFASIVALGIKTLETRSWCTSYRGPLAIHAAKRKMASQYEWIWTRACIQAHVPFFAPPLGCIVATCDLVDVFPADWVGAKTLEQEGLYGDFSSGRFAWRLANVKPLKAPIPCRGRQGFFHVPIQHEHAKPHPRPVRP